jgi:hypothetical protein
MCEIGSLIQLGIWLAKLITIAIVAIAEIPSLAESSMIVRLCILFIGAPIGILFACQFDISSNALPRY